MATKEEVYDEQINPLMAQIIDICKANKIAFVASFALTKEEEDDEALLCSSMLIEDEYEPPVGFFDIRNVLFPRRISGLTMTVRDGNDKIKEVVKFL